MSNHFDNDDSGMLRLPSPDNPASGYTPREPAGFARGEAPPAAPEGMTFVPELGTYVDSDVASQLGIVGQQSPAMNPEGIPRGHDDTAVDADPDDYEISDDELARLQDELEANSGREPSLSQTLDEIAACFTPEAFKDGMDAMVATGDFGDTLVRVSEATGMDFDTSFSLIETSVMEVAPVAAESIGEERWNALLHAASHTDDPFARRVVADVVTGALKPSRLAKAYALWWNSLPDASDEEGCHYG